MGGYSGKLGDTVGIYRNGKHIVQQAPALEKGLVPPQLQTKAVEMRDICRILEATPNSIWDTTLGLYWTRDEYKKYWMREFKQNVIGIPASGLTAKGFGNAASQRSPTIQIRQFNLGIGQISWSSGTYPTQFPEDTSVRRIVLSVGNDRYQLLRSQLAPNTSQTTGNTSAAGNPKGEVLVWYIIVGEQTRQIGNGIIAKLII